MRKIPHIFPLFVLVALCSSALHPLSAELLSQSMLRGEWLKLSGYLPSSETLSAFRNGAPWNPLLSLGDILTHQLFFTFGETSVFVATALTLSLATVVLYLSLVSIGTSFAFLVTLFAALALWTGISDFPTAVGAFCCTGEI